MSYQIGDKIVYPMHGAGIIDSIEEREILGNTHSYFIMKMPISDMKVMIPVNNTEAIGIRNIISADEASNVIENMKKDNMDMISNWNKRYRENMDKIKKGDIREISLVLKALLYREKTKGLSTGERKMLNSTKHIVISELVLSKSSTYDEIESLINSIVQMQIDSETAQGNN